MRDERSESGFPPSSTAGGAPMSLALAELGRLEWAKGLSAAALEDFAANAELAEIGAGVSIMDFDAPLTHAFFVLTGRLKTTLREAVGERSQEYYSSRGGVIGLFAIAAYEKSPMSIVAVEHSTVFRLSLAALQKLLSAHPDFQIAVLRLGSDVVKQIITANRTLPRAAVIGVVHLSDATRSLTSKLATRLAELGETVAVAGDDSRWAPGSNVPFKIAFVEGRPVDSGERESILKEWSEFNRLFVDVRLDGFVSETVRLLEAFPQSVLWCITPTEADLAMKILSRIYSQYPRFREKVQLVWLLSGDAAVPPYRPELLSLVHRDFKLSFDAPRPNQGQLLSKGIDRIIRFLRGVQIGLALGGGAARGMAHLGVLRALEDSGIFVDRIAGTSAGAMTGTIYCVGMSPEYATHCFKTDLEPSWIYKKLPGSGYWYLLSKYRRHRFEPMLRKYLHDYRAEQLAIPMTTVAVDLVEGEPLIRSTGDATRNILESINLPPLSLPIFDSGQAVVDGGLLNNVPANVLVAQGCNFVIASTVTAKLEKEFMGMKAKGKPMRSRFFSTIQVILRQSLIQSYSMNSVGVQPADFVIAPDVTKFDLSEFTRADEMAEVGVAAATEGVEKLKTLLSRLDSQLFRG